MSEGPGREEMIEVLDASGRPAGLRARSECHSDPALAHRAVHVFVLNARGEIYLQKRASGKLVQPGRWDTSAGGHVMPGESWEDAARRELEEELGIAPASETEGEGPLRRRHGYVWRSPIETEHVRTFEVTSEGPFSLHPEEIEEGRFWTADELRRAAGTGVLTPNLEEELGRLGVLEREP